MQYPSYMRARAGLGVVLGISSLVSMGLYVAGALSNHANTYSYLPWNLFLSWIPLGLALWLEWSLRTRPWSSWYMIGVTLLWLLFLPNAFYMISDFIHIQEVERVDLLYDAVMFSSFIFNGVILGFLSLYIVHWQLALRLKERAAAVVIGFVLLMCSFAIYIGRELRWNSWDVLANPASLLFDVSERLLHLSNYPQVLTTTLSFLALLASTYTVLWYAARVLRQQYSPKQ